jgi:transposase
MAYQIHPIKLENEFKTCPLCSYKDGFHSMLKRDGDEIKWLFICPACHEVFDVGQTLER